ncbi:signal transduction histidine kinase [Brevundimonas vesicularis]|nr:signal transduction histidine kinase [Brevundimonas vesicularis]
MQAWDALKRPIWMFDPVALRGVYANAAALDLWGSDNLDALLARDFSNVSPAVLARTERLARETANGETLTEDWTFYPHGRPLTVSAVISTYRLTDGTPVLLFEAAPITVENEERRAVEALRHTSTLITLFDSEARPIFSNPSAFAAYGSTTHPFEARFAEPERAQPMLAAALSGSAISDVCEIITREGVRWHHLDIRPVTDPVTGHLGVMLNEIDVTDRVEAEQARVAAEQKTSMAEARQKFLTDMSHELRTPLNAVIGFSDLLSKAGLPDEQADQAARINGAGQRLLSVVNDMIDLSSDNGVPLSPSDTPAEPAPPANEDAPALRVLYVDDHDSNRALVMAVLTAQGIACATANDGEQARRGRPHRRLGRDPDGYPDARNGRRRGDPRHPRPARRDRPHPHLGPDRQHPAGTADPVRTGRYGRLHRQADEHRRSGHARHRLGRQRLAHLRSSP